MKNMKLALLAMGLMATSFGMGEDNTSLSDKLMIGALVAWPVVVVSLDLVGVGGTIVGGTIIAPTLYPIVQRQVHDLKFREIVKQGFGYEPAIKEFNKQRAFERDLFEAEGF